MSDLRALARMSVAPEARAAGAGTAFADVFNGFLFR